MSEIVVYEDTPFAEYIQGTLKGITTWRFLYNFLFACVIEIEGFEYVVSQEQSRSSTMLNNLRALAYDYWTNYSLGKVNTL